MLNWKNLKTRRQTLRAEIIHKSINGLVPEYLTRKFIQRSDVNPYNLRDFENKFAFPLLRTNYTGYTGKLSHKFSKIFI